jgi:hypothetical protein
MVTEGGNPVYEVDALGLPVYTVGIGDTSDRRDVLIRSVLTNSLAYVDTKVPVAVDIRSSGYRDERVEVLLRGDEGVLDRHVLQLAEGKRRYEVNLSLTPAEAGMQRYTINVSVLSNDAVPSNNRSSFYVKVLEKKLTVALIAGGPSPDVAFIRRSLEGDASLTVRAYIERSTGYFYEGPLLPTVLRDADCLIMVGYPTSRSRGDTFAHITDAIEGGKNFLLLFSRTTDGTMLKRLETDLPATVFPVSGGEQEIFLSVAVGHRMSPLVRGAGESDPVQYWTQLPPVIMRDVRIVPRPEAKVLLVARFQNVRSSDAVYVSRSVGQRKSLLFAAYGIWQWNMHAVEQQEDPVSAFLSSAVQWLSTREEEKPLRVQPVKEVFSGQEPVELMAQVYDETLQPVDVAEVRVELTGNDQNLVAIAQPLGSGRYRAVFEGLTEGTYAFSGTAASGGVELGADQGSFSVGELTVEFQDVRLNAKLLQEVADRSGGQFFRAPEIDGLARAIASHPRFQVSQSERATTVELWNAPWLLGILILLLATEWTLRKRSGML